MILRVFKEILELLKIFYAEVIEVFNVIIVSGLV